MQQKDVTFKPATSQLKLEAYMQKKDSINTWRTTEAVVRISPSFRWLDIRHHLVEAATSSPLTSSKRDSIRLKSSPLAYRLLVMVQASRNVETLS